MSELKYYKFEDIIRFLGLDRKFEYLRDVYPFNRDPKDIVCSWGQILIPEKGIEDTILNRLSDTLPNEYEPLTDINMMYQIPFIHNNKTGIINQDISLTWRYDKTHKYGDITSGIAEVCFYIYKHAMKTNNFYIITNDDVMLFFSKYIIPNQWGIGNVKASSPCCTDLGFIKNEEDLDEEKKDYK